MRRLASAEFESFVSGAPSAAIHFDAEWDMAYRGRARQRMEEAERSFGARVRFAEVDIDREPELARSIPIMNVPAVAYYRDGRLVAALTGADQNVRGRVARVMRGESIGYDDGLSNFKPPATTNSPR